MSTAPVVSPPLRRAARPMSRVGCVVSMLVWLCVMTIPFLALWLAVKGELTWRRGEFVEDRLWLVNAESGVGHGGASGVGYSSTRVLTGQIAADGPVCVRTRVYFLLWKGQSENVTFCDCYTPVEGGGYEAHGSCP